MPRLHSIIFLAALCSGLLFGCNTQSHLGGDDGGADGATDAGGAVCGPSICGDGLVCCNASCGVCAPPGVACTTIACEDGGPPPPIDGGAGEECGPVFCSPGTVCCNASCGICVEPGMGCPAIACADGGPPPATECSGLGTGECGEGMFCRHAEGCGFDFGPGTCEPMPEGCTADCPGVCGCDGMDYCNECTAAGSGMSIAHASPCGPTVACAAQDAMGVGACAAFFGYAWDGYACVGISGCDCVGADCGAFSTVGDCEAAHADCDSPPPPLYSCGGIAGVTCPDGYFCDYPDGSFCGGDDSLGFCVRRPSPACPEIYSPVCGCDGMTYSNGCFANAAGQDIVHTGECAP